MVETTKENRLNPFHYLSHLFEKLPNLDLTLFARWGLGLFV
ncbi:MAG: transposase domain-containing protein [Desulfosporosinus sp.]|nr:transposase domain-containing protein [Desulfosporosinus sp.]